MHIAIQTRPELRLALMTSFDSIQICQEAEIIGTIIIQKPFNIHDIVNKLQNSLSMQSPPLLTEFQI